MRRLICYSRVMFRLIFTVYLAAVWLLITYPYGLLLFIVGACWYGALKSRQLSGNSGPRQLTTARSLRLR